MFFHVFPFALEEDESMDLHYSDQRCKAPIAISCGNLGKRRSLAGACLFPCHCVEIFVSFCHSVIFCRDLPVLQGIHSFLRFAAANRHTKGLIHAWFYCRGTCRFSVRDLFIQAQKQQESIFVLPWLSSFVVASMMMPHGRCLFHAWMMITACLSARLSLKEDTTTVTPESEFLVTIFKPTPFGNRQWKSLKRIERQLAYNDITYIQIQSNTIKYSTYFTWWICLIF